MKTLIRNLLMDLREVWADPQADPQRTVVFIAVAAILVLLLFVVMLLVISWGPRRSSGAGARSHRRRRVSAALMAPGVVLMLAGAWLAADEFATAPTTCGRCHEIAPSVITWNQSEHAGTDCMGCHGQSGVMGYVATRVRGLSNLTSHYLRGNPILQANVIDSSCLGCHRAIETGTTEFRSIRVRHQDFIGRGASCLRCHGDSGHAVTVEFVERPTMDKCLACHDNQTASASCDVCHLNDVAEVRDIPDNYPKAHLAEKRTCEGCHSLDSCRKCHGLEMPHPPTFASAEHAPLAAFSGKDKLCYRCHEPEDCRRCHQSFDAHGPDWVTRHTLTPRSPQLECRNCHDQIPTAIMCDFCHEP